MVERSLSMREVRGSIPCISTPFSIENYKADIKAQIVRINLYEIKNEHLKIRNYHLLFQYSKTFFICILESGTFRAGNSVLVSPENFHQNFIEV